MSILHRRIWAATMAALLFTGTACETSKTVSSTTAPVVAETEQEENEVAIPDLDYEKYTLENGLEVILHQDHSDPIVAVSILYHVGSSREKPGRTGFAHFFEHMLFQSSENVPKGYFFSKINDLGGTFNGGTWTDGTIYYETVPKDALEKVLWMESDRMGFFINTVTKAALENEKLVVKNEKRQRYDNQPYGHSSYVINKTLYPADHPYNWLTIGSLADLQAATLDDVKEFYQSYYGTNNATLVVAGDFKKEEAREWIKKYFGEIKDAAPVKPLEPQLPQISTNAKIYHEDAYAKVPELTLVWPTVELFSEDSYALDVLGDLLADGKSAPLYNVLVEQQKLAPSARAYNSSQELAGTFNVKVRAFDGKDLDKVYAAVMAAIDSFAVNGFTEEDLERIKNQQETSFYNGLTSVFGKAYQLAYYNEFAGSPDALTTDIEKSRNVTKADVMRVFNKYIRNNAHIIASFVPKGQLELAVEGSAKAAIEEEDISAAVTQTYDEKAEATELVKTPSSFDRSIEPALGQAPTLTVPQIWDTELSNGLNVYGIRYNELPVVQISVRLMGGGTLEAPGKTGVANLLTDVLMEGTATKTPEELEEAIGQLGASISVVADKESITLYANTLARNYEEVMKLVNEILLQPRWDAQEFARLKEAQLNRIQQSEANPDVVASDVFSKLVYGPEHTMAQPLRGTKESVSAITIDDLKAYYNKNFSPAVASFHIVGMIDKEDVLESLQPLAEGWPTKEVNIPTMAAKPVANKPALFFVDVPDAKQSVIRIGKLAELTNSDDYFAANVANYHLGQGSGGLLFRVLREEKGYTYGAYSGFNRNAYSPGFFTAYSSVQSNVTKEAVETFKNILETYKETYSEAELEKTRQSLIRQDSRAYETPYQKLGVLQTISSYNMPKDYMVKNQEIIRNITLPQTKELIQKYMNPNEMVYLVVGDAKTQLPRMQELKVGTPIVLDAKGNVVTEQKVNAAPAKK